MKSFILLILFFSLMIILSGCKDYSKVYFGGTVQNIMNDVKKNQNVLDKIHTAYRKKKKCNAYEQICFELQLRWASPKVMAEWCKIWLNSVYNSKEKFRTDRYCNSVACQALIWFIMANDKEAIRKLPTLVAYPLFEDAKRKFLSSTAKEFAKWAYIKINPFILKYRKDDNYYCELLEAAGYISQDYKISLNACEKFYYMYPNPGGTLDTITASKIAYYSDKVGNISKKNQKILIDYYKMRIKDKHIINILRKREEYILYVLKKYKITP